MGTSNSFPRVVAMMSSGIFDVCHKGIQQPALPENDADFLGSECTICCDEEVIERFLMTDCCQQLMCERCYVRDGLRKEVRTCPFCREPQYTVQGQRQVQPDRPLEGIWDVRVVEKSPAGSVTHSAIMTIAGDCGRFESGSGYFEGGCWDGLAVGHTPSGRSFCATQRLSQAPPWMPSSARCHGGSQVDGRVTGRDLADFTSSLSVSDRKGDTVLVQYQCQMRRRC